LAGGILILGIYIKMKADVIQKWKT
jgi:hypothetical protein